MADEKQVVEKKEPSTLSSSLGIDLNSMPKFKNKEAQESVSRNIDVGTKVSQSEADLKKAELEQKTNLLGAESKVLKDYAQKSREDVEQIESKELEYPRKEFHPTKENAESLGQLFSMVATFGLLVGNSGKLASQNALGAMTGMLKGWQIGRKDLYERELKEFDKEYKRIQDIHTDLQNSLNRLNKLRITDRDAALKEEAYLSAVAGDQSIIGAYAKNKNFQAIQKALDSGEKLDMQVTKIKNQSAQFEKNLQMQRDRIQAQKDIAALKASGEGVKGALPKDKETKKIYANRYQTIKTVEEIENLLKDPEYAKLINPGTKFTPDVLANLQEGYPELSSKLARLTSIEFETGGKSLTAKEQEILGPIYQWRGLTVDALKQKLNEAKNYIQNENKMTEVYYPGLKELNPQFDAIFKQSGTVPVIPDDVGGGGQTYQLNQIIDRGGKRYRVIGGSADDPDIEEVK